jgi:hypothetical protein
MEHDTKPSTETSTQTVAARPDTSPADRRAALRLERSKRLADHRGTSFLRLVNANR